MIQLAIQQQQWDAVRAVLQADERETAAYLLIGRARGDGVERLTVCEVHLPLEDDYAVREHLRLSVKPSFINRIAARCEQTGAGLLAVHSHPMQDEDVGFSPVDDRGEARELKVFHHLLPGAPLASLVLGRSGWAGRTWSFTQAAAQTQRIDELVLVGTNVEVLPPRPVSDQTDHDRQTRAFGPAGQARLAGARFLVVGTGGTGSAAFEMLARAGVGHITVVDDDMLEATNVSRVFGSRFQDIGQPKVALLANAATEYSATTVRPVSTRLEKARAAAVGADVILVCTDTHLSRAVANELAYRLLVPLIDVGTRVVRGAQAPTYIGGQYTRVGPGFPCLQCWNTIDHEAASAEALSDDERARRRAEGYVKGGGDPQPAVISYNAAMSALAVSRALAIITHAPAPQHDKWTMDFLTGELRPAMARRNPECMCSRVEGRGA